MAAPVEFRPSGRVVTGTPIRWWHDHAHAADQYIAVSARLRRRFRFALIGCWSALIGIIVYPLLQKIGEDGGLFGVAGDRFKGVREAFGAWFSRPSVAATAAGLASVLAALLIVRFLSSRDREASARMRAPLHDPRELSDQVPDVTVTIVPMDEDPLRSIPTAEGPLNEAIHSLRVALRPALNGEPRRILVTSTLPNEGKSTVAWGLARAFSLCRSKTLLIDADLRRPSFQVGADPARGLSFALATDTPLDEILRPSDLPLLSVISAGTPPPNVPQLLSKLEGGAKLDEVSARFSTVIIDAPPVLGLADAPILAQECTDVVYIVEAGRVPLAAILRSLDRLGAPDARVTLVLTKATQRQLGGTGFAYEYGYGYGYVDKQRDHVVKDGDPEAGS